MGLWSLIRMTLRLENNARAQPFIAKNFRCTLPTWGDALPGTCGNPAVTWSAGSHLGTNEYQLVDYPEYCPAGELIDEVPG